MKDIIKKKQEQCAEKILEYLNKKLDKNNGYPDKTSWGYAFTYLAGSMSESYSGFKLKEKSLEFLKKQDIKDKNYPWEFIVFALKESYSLNGKRILHPGSKLRKKGTPVLNWRILHIYNKIQFEKTNFFDEIYLRFLIKTHQRKNGLLMDEYLTRSLQYHNFSLFLLLKIYEKKRNYKWLRDKITLATEYSLKHIFSDGTSQYIGRGQEQIFGYGSLIAALKIFQEIFKKDLDSSIYKLLNKVLKFQKENGFIPLVLRSNNPEKDNESFSSTSKPSGWYSYNSSFDYLPFLSYCLLIKK